MLPTSIILVLAALIGGDPDRRDRFEDVIAQFGPALGRLAATYARPGAERDDLEQEILLAVWQALPRFRGDASLRTYVFRIAHNRCIDVLRKKQASALEEPDEVDHQGPSPERLASARQDLERVASAMRELPLSQRQALFLALEGLSHAEIGDAMGISEGAISVRIHRARKALGARLDQKRGEGDG